MRISTLLTAVCFVGCMAIAAAGHAQGVQTGAAETRVASEPADYAGDAAGPEIIAAGVGKDQIQIQKVSAVEAALVAILLLAVPAQS